MDIAAPRNSYSEFLRSNYFPSLNGIRAICAILVIKEHVSWRIHGAPQLLEWGFLGVDMFFIISGFLIVTLLLREQDRTGRIDLKQFYVRRTLRIFPIYYLMLAGLFLLAVTTYKHSTKTWDLYRDSFPVFILYLQDLIPVSMGIMFHTWSLSMEEQFYLVWPTIEKYFSTRWIITIILALIGFWQLCNFGLLAPLWTDIYGGPEGPIRPIFLITFTPILLGVLAAHALHNQEIGQKLADALQNRWLPLIFLAIAGLACQYSSELQGTTRLVVHLSLCLMLISLVINPHGVFSTTLQSRPLHYLGSISYGIYLYHTLIIWLIEMALRRLGTELTPWAMFTLVTPLSIALAAASFKYFETPIMNLGRHKTASQKLAV